jgi:hypothetical protein
LTAITITTSRIIAMIIARMITAVRLIGNPFPGPCLTTTRPVELHRTPVYFFLKGKSRMGTLLLASRLAW